MEWILFLKRLNLDRIYGIGWISVAYGEARLRVLNYPDNPVDLV